MKIIGAHSIIYSSNAKADRDFFKKILKFPFVDVGQGWLIFSLPPSEVAVHPIFENEKQEFYLMCDDIDSFVNEMAKNKIKCSKIESQPWGQLIYLTLPGGGEIGVYEPRHERPASGKKTPKAKAASKTKKKSVKKKKVQRKS